jgi:hypothetical protein
MHRDDLLCNGNAELNVKQPAGTREMSVGNVHKIVLHLMDISNKMGRTT